VQFGLIEGLLNTQVDGPRNVSDSLQQVIRKSPIVLFFFWLYPTIWISMEPADRSSESG